MTLVNKDVEEITEGEFWVYEEVRVSGRWNMFTPIAREATTLDKETYFGIIKHYDTLKAKWPVDHHKELSE